MKAKNTKKPVVHLAGAKHTLGRVEQLTVVKAMLDSIEHVKSEAAVYDVLLRTLQEHKWLAIYLRCVFCPEWKYGLKSKYLDKVPFNKKTGGRLTGTLDIIYLISKLLMKLLTPKEAVREWRAMLMSLPEDIRPVANRVLDKDFSPLTRKMANKAMKECGISPLT